MSHSHNYKDSTGKRNILFAFLLNFGFACIEFAGGLLTNSVAILSDALHDLGDSISLLIAWYLAKKSGRKGDRKFSFGYKRFSLLGALLNSLILIAGAVYVLSEAIPRVIAPEPVKATGMLVLAILGICVNGAAVFIMKGGKSINERVVTWHLMEDVLGWAAVLIVSIVFHFADVYILDPLLSIIITLYILYNVFKNLRETVFIFLQGVPKEFSIDDIENDMKAIDGVKSVHHTHIWSLDGEHHVVTSHVVIEQNSTREQAVHIKTQIKRLLQRHSINHLTIEVEYENEDCYMRE